MISDIEFIELCKKGSLQQIVDAIKNGAKVNTRDKDGMTPLMWAIRGNSDPDVLQTLIDNGANVDTTDRHGRRALDHANDVIKSKGADAYRIIKRNTVIKENPNNKPVTSPNEYIEGGFIMYDVETHPN